MKNLTETKILTNVHLSDAQKLVMAKIKAAANANVAAEQARNSTNLAAAQKSLSKLGLVQVDDTGATLTDKGIKTMTDENLMDESGELTTEGQRYADAKDLEALSKKDTEQPSEEPVAPDVDGDGAGDAPLTDAPISEAMSLFKDINAMAKIKLL